MRHIVGYVLVKETNTGIPNLVVAVHDGELAIEDIRRQHPTATLMKKLGRRMGSVLTDADGKFVFTADDLEFPGNEPRPDLAVAVFAPEDVVDLKHPYPLPPEERVLYLSVSPRPEAGAQEAFVIRLPAAQIDEFQIDIRSDRLASAVDKAWQFNETVTKRLAERTRQAQKRAAERRDAAREKVKNLSAVPAALRDHPLLVVGKAALAKKAPVLQAKTISDGLAKMAKSKTPPTVRLYLTTADLPRFGLHETKGKVAGRLTHDDLTSAIRSMMGGVVYTRSSPPPSRQDVDALEAKYLGSPATLTPTPAPKGATAKTPGRPARPTGTPAQKHRRARSGRKS